LVWKSRTDIFLRRRWFKDRAAKTWERGSLVLEFNCLELLLETKRRKKNAD
jgi:hypothetical protein